MTVKQLHEALDRMERGQYTGFTIGQLTDKIAWLWKWKKNSHDEMEMMALQAIHILGGEDIDDNSNEED